MESWVRRLRRLVRGWVVGPARGRAPEPPTPAERLEAAQRRLKATIQVPEGEEAA
ncbi:MAG: hypothetical protein ACJ764_12065 [Solirubrobacteraceae bacterium]